MTRPTPKPRNEQAAALHHRASNAGVAVAVNTQPQVIPNKKKRVERKTTREMLSED